MNSKLRTKINDAVNKVYAVIQELDTVQKEEQENFDNLHKFTKQDTAGDNMRQAVQTLKDNKSLLFEITTELQAL